MHVCPSLVSFCVPPSSLLVLSPSFPRLSLSREGEEQVKQKPASWREMYIEQYGDPGQWEKECSYVSRSLLPLTLLVCKV